MLSLDDCRRFYAEEIQFAAHLTSLALIEAFARVPREKFLGPGPWHVAMPDMLTGAVKYTATPDDDARRVYHNVVIALDRSRDLTNGQPGTLAHYINALNLAPGERVYHLGAGTGYYTAIMAEVVGPDGSIVAAEVHPELGPVAQKNLAYYQNVTIHAADGSEFDPGECDAMLINAGVTHPLPLWLDRLRPGGRLMTPITVSMGPNLGKGVMLKITRKAGGYAAQTVTFVAIYSAIGARDPQLEPALGKAMATGALMRVKSVRCDQHSATETCVVHGSQVCLSLAEVV
ncbi:MAG TPA: rRNA adenine N-6-methyltransferase family protein [Candidatus Angelobacter sp.]